MAKFVRIVVNIDKKDLVLIKSIIEGEDDVGIVRTVQNAETTSIIEILSTSDMAPEVHRILDKLSQTLPIRDMVQVG